MLKTEKIFALIMLTTFLISTPLALACTSSEVCSVVYVYKYDDNNGKPPGLPGAAKPKEKDLGYDFLRDGYQWKDLPIEIVLDDELAIYQGAIESAMEEWDSHAEAVLFATSITVANEASFDSNSPDGKNELVFGDYPQDGVIAVCITWFYRHNV
jgi:hypothetical protein